MYERLLAGGPPRVLFLCYCTKSETEVEYVTARCYLITEQEIPCKRGGIFTFFIHLVDSIDNSCVINYSFD